MCGISGIVGLVENKFEKLTIMNDVLLHRGPDGSGIYISEDGIVGFGHRRLSIIDLTDNGSQPMHYLDRYTITYNGEIYNYLELRKKLLDNNCIIQTNTDTEIILALFHCYNEKCVDYLDGMFAFAIYDNHTHKIFIARDRFGEKPFYYFQDNNTFYFASEMKALWSIGIKKNPNKLKINDYLVSNDIDSTFYTNHTFYSNIYKFPPACFAFIENNNLKNITKYWTADYSKINYNISFKDAVLEFNRLLNKSVHLRMRSDVSLGSSLSGGIDSTVIVTEINKQINSNQKQKTFSARFNNFDKDEGYFIDLALKSLKNTNGYNIYPNAQMFVSDLDKLVYYQEEPFRTASQYNQFCVMKLAAENNVVVLLDGQGADEILGGYLEYYFHYLSQLLCKNPFNAFNEIKSYQNLQRNYRPYRAPRRLPLWLMQKYLGKKMVFDQDVRELMCRDTTQTHLPTLLRYGDKNSMAFSREVRLPFLSHELVDFVYSLPINYLLNSGWTKYILRNAYKDMIPNQIAWRIDKIGFEPPQDDWMQLLKDEVNFAKNSIALDNFGIPSKIQMTDWKWLMLNRFFNC